MTALVAVSPQDHPPPASHDRFRLMRRIEPTRIERIFSICDSYCP